MNNTANVFGSAHGMSATRLSEIKGSWLGGLTSAAVHTHMYKVSAHWRGLKVEEGVLGFWLGPQASMLPLVNRPLWVWICFMKKGKRTAFSTDVLDLMILIWTKMKLSTASSRSGSVSQNSATIRWGRKGVSLKYSVRKLQKRECCWTFLNYPWCLLPTRIKTFIHKKKCYSD